MADISDLFTQASQINVVQFMGYAGMIMSPLVMLGAFGAAPASADDASDAPAQHSPYIAERSGPGPALRILKSLIAASLLFCLSYGMAQQKMEWRQGARTQSALSLMRADIQLGCMVQSKTPVPVTLSGFYASYLTAMSAARAYAARAYLPETCDGLNAFYANVQQLIDAEKEKHINPLQHTKILPGLDLTWASLWQHVRDQPALARTTDKT